MPLDPEFLIYTHNSFDTQYIITNSFRLRLKLNTSIFPAIPFCLICSYETSYLVSVCVCDEEENPTSPAYAAGHSWLSSCTSGGVFTIRDTLCKRSKTSVSICDAAQHLIEFVKSQGLRSGERSSLPSFINYS